MDVRNWVTEDEVLAALNVEPPGPTSYSRFLEKFSKGTDPEPLKLEGQGFLREWIERANKEVKNRLGGFVLNYLATAPLLVLPPAPAGQGWHLPDTISRKEAKPMRAGICQ